MNDAQVLASLLPDGRVIMDEVAMTSEAGMPGNGHGTYLFGQRDRSLRIRTLHADKESAHGIWEINYHGTESSSGQFSGVATLRLFASLQDWQTNQAPVRGLKTE